MGILYKPSLLQGHPLPHTSSCCSFSHRDLNLIILPHYLVIILPDKHFKGEGITLKEGGMTYLKIYLVLSVREVLTLTR
jgi:hypothetical protein